MRSVEMVICLAMGSVAFPACAQEAVPRRDTVTIGLGGAYGPSYEGSDDYGVFPIGALRGKVAGIAFFARGPQLFVDIISEKDGDTLDFEAGPVAGVRLNRTSRIIDPQVRALGKLDTAVELGGFVGIGKTGVITSAYDSLSARVSYTRDVAGAHRSYVVAPSIDYGTPLSKTTYVGVGVSATIVGNRYAKTYFDVSAAGSLASGLAPYTAKGGVKDVSIALFAAKSLSADLRRGWSIFAIGSYAKLLGPFKRSPIVASAGSANQWFGGGGLAYTF